MVSMNPEIETRKRLSELPFAQIVQKKTVKDFECIIPSEQEYYSHPTFTVSNLTDYIRLVLTISSVGKKADNWDTVVYRGMADSGFNLLPGLARINGKDSETEVKLINEFSARRPDAFTGLSEFDMLAKMQHFGLPTRLLDFSLNPLVALYFACESNGTKDGRVLCHGTFLSNDSSAYVTSVCTTAIRNPFDENYTVEEYYCNEKLSLRKYMTEAYLYDVTTVVRPKYWNQRITNQAGVFMIFPNHAIDRYRSILTHEDKLGIDDAILQYGRGEIDKSIIEEALRVEPIDVYRTEEEPYLTSSCFKRMKEAYSNNNKDGEFWNIIKNRFSPTCEVKPLSKEIISNGFCSIIIGQKNKKKILQELSYVGIRTDYIYPELEYTAKEIRRNLE